MKSIVQTYFWLKDRRNKFLAISPTQIEDRDDSDEDDRTKDYIIPDEEDEEEEIKIAKDCAEGKCQSIPPKQKMTLKASFLPSLIIYVILIVSNV